MITSNISSSGLSRNQGVDASGNPYVEFQLIIKNTHSTDSVTISEIGYIGSIGNGQIMQAQNSTSSVSAAMQCLMDRTLLTTPLTLEAGETGIIDYRITIDIS